jgi:hypothetical protein
MQFQPVQMRPNAMMQMGMQALNMGKPQQTGLLQRLLNPPAAPLNLAPPGVAPMGGMGQPGLLAKLFPALGQQQPQVPMMPQGDPTGGLGPIR